MSDQGSGQAAPPPQGQVGAVFTRSQAITNLATHLFGGAPPGGGKFTMDLDQLKDAISRCDALLTNLQKDERTAQPMVQVKPAGSELDAVGAEFANRANESGRNYLKANMSAQKFVKVSMTARGHRGGMRICRLLSGPTSAMRDASSSCKSVALGLGEPVTAASSAYLRLF